jgi:hypothetical protein
MRKPNQLHMLALIVVLVLFVVSFSLVSAAPANQRTNSLGDVFGVTTGNRLISFNRNNPNSIRSNVQITNLRSGEHVLGIDYRATNGKLYAVGSSNRVYTIDPNTGRATPVAGIFTPSRNGNSFGLDFNPTVDKVRFVSDLDQNLRLDPDLGTALFVDGTLKFAPTDVNSRGNPNVSGVAYTNNFAGATATTLYGIDSFRDILVIQNPPNDGVLTTVGKIGIDTTSLVGFDITDGNAAYASLTKPGSKYSDFYSINLSTGRATLIGRINKDQTLRGITIVPK